MGAVSAAYILLATLPCAAAENISLTLPSGSALHIALESDVRVKDPGTPVKGRLVEPVFVYDRMVLPAGAQVLGSVHTVVGPTRGQRALSIANGDFTPLRVPTLDFHTVVLADGSRVPLHTSVSQGIPKVVHLTAGGGKKKGRIRTAIDQAEQNARDKVHQTLDQAKAPGKWKRLKQAAIERLPYHRQWIRQGTQFTAELTAPLDLGSAETATPLSPRDSDIPPGSLVKVSLVTALNSKTDRTGTPVAALISEPLFSPDHRLLLPAGTRLEGSVTESVAARYWHRNGKLRFAFQQIDPGQGSSTPRRVQASLEGIEADASQHLKVDSEGGAHAVTPKTNAIAPAIHVVIAASSLDGLDPHRKLHPNFHQGPDTAGGAIKGASGLGFIGSVIGLASHYRPVGAVFAFYGAGWSVYTHFIGRGTNVVFAKDTPMDIRFGKRNSKTETALNK